MKAFLRKLNSMLEGFRGLIAIWIPIGAVFMDTLFSGLAGFTMQNIKTAALLAVVPTVKLIWTDAIPKMVTLYNNWLNKP